MNINLKTIRQLWSNMGPRYLLFRAAYEFKRRTGLLKRKFPTHPPFQQFISLEQWRKKAPPFFFDSKEVLKIPKKRSTILQSEVQKMKRGEFPFFSSQYFDFSKIGNWRTHPVTGFCFPKDRHWTEVEEFAEGQGDIKYVWERARFSFLYTIIRYDYHYEEDQSEWVFSLIEDFISDNPINQGPNFKCSQEIALRSMNWIFALYYYKSSEALTSDRFLKIMHYIYWQLRHIRENIDFSRIAVRNNHTITECLALFIAGILFPFFPEAKKWRKRGKQWFEEEIEYQIYEDGTYLQFSLNYERAVVQLLCWALQLAKQHNIPFKKVVYQRAKAATQFLFTCQDQQSGQLPNYGANDGALFFPLNDNAYRDYRPQLDALSSVLGIQLYDVDFEDKYWFGLVDKNADQKIRRENGPYAFEKGGIYVLREDRGLSFIRCGKHKDRPSQADNLHLDLWYDGENILRDAGSFLYNTEDKWINYFNGTRAHNTVMIDNYDQMEKGPRFIWYHWSQGGNATWLDKDDHFLFKGQILAFQQLESNIIHTRNIRKYKGKPVWDVMDRIENLPYGLSMHQNWHPHPNWKEKMNIYPIGTHNEKVVMEWEEGYFSSVYGVKERSDQLKISTSGHSIQTRILISGD